MPRTLHRCAPPDFKLTYQPGCMSWYVDHGVPGDGVGLARHRRPPRCVQLRAGAAERGQGSLQLVISGKLGILGTLVPAASLMSAAF